MIGLNALWRRLLFVIGRGRVTLVTDGGQVQLVQGRQSAAEVPGSVARIAEYGFQSNPPAGSDFVTVRIGGDLNHGVIIATNNQTYRMKGLATGEVAISDDKGQSVYLSASGIRIDGGGMPITIDNAPSIELAAPTITLTGAIVLNGPVTSGSGAGAGPVHLTGPVTVDNDVIANGTSVDGHVHTSGGAGSPTSPPL